MNTLQAIINILRLRAMCESSDRPEDFKMLSMYMKTQESLFTDNEIVYNYIQWICENQVPKPSFYIIKAIEGIIENE